MLYVHPPLAIAGYALIFLFAGVLFFSKKQQGRKSKTIGVISWVLTFLGLFTGMLWAQMAWGSYWTWDPKEIMTLVLFLAVSMGQAVYFEKRYTAAKWLAVLACILTVLTASSSFVIAGLHSYT